MIFDWIIIATIYFASLAWGGNEPWAMAILAAGALLAFAGRLLWDSRSGQVRFGRDWAFVPILLLLAYVFLQMLLPRVGLEAPQSGLPHTVEPYTTRMYFLLALGYGAVVFAVSHGFRSRKQVKILILCIFLLAVFEALYCLVQSLLGTAHIWNFPIESGSARGTFVNRNHFALLLNLGFCSGFGYLYYRAARLLSGRNRTILSVISSPESARLMWIILSLALTGFALVMSMSRMGIVAMFAGIGVMIIAGKCARSGKRPAAVAWSILFVVLTVALYIGIGSVLNRDQPLSAGHLERDRMPIWRDAFNMIRANPVAGNGLGTFQWTFGAYEKFEPDVPARYAHNDYLQALAEVGAPGLVLFLAAFVLFWGSASKNLRYSSDPLVQGIGMATLGMLTAVALQEITDFSLYIPGVAACFAGLMGLNLRARRMR